VTKSLVTYFFIKTFIADATQKSYNVAMQILNEQDLENVFLKQKQKKKLPLYLIYIILFVVIYVLFYLLSNSPAYLQKVTWWYKNEVSTSTPATEPIVKTTNNGTPIVQDSIKNIEDNHIFIPKIGANAPILWNIKNVDDVMQKALESGVAHILGTALPGQRGNGFITGHSSNYLWAKGGYKTIFSLQSKLVVGDQFMIKYQGKNYVYKVTRVITTKPTDSEVLKQDKKKNEFSLITCVPVGTSLYRLITTGEQIYPKVK